MITLAIDASTYAGDVAVIRDDRVLGEETTAMKGADEERLMPAVARVLDAAGVVVSDIGRVVCGAGPGSFTSLRIAGAIAKGIAMGVGCPLYAVSSMALIVAGDPRREPGRYVAAVDALRGEHYVALYAVDAVGHCAELEPARLIGSAELASVAASYAAKIVSPAASAGGTVSAPRARAVARLEHMLEAPVNIGAWEPAYGRLAEAQVKWESAHGRPLPTG
jgi:tRNA threonylcarbamoyladenosine biosynthesis protein TsaB